MQSKYIMGLGRHNIYEAIRKRICLSRCCWHEEHHQVHHDDEIGKGWSMRDDDS